MKIQEHTDLEVYEKAFDAAMHVSKEFPKEETYSIRRSSRSVCANLAEAWRKRRYKAAFIAKLSDAESEAAETRVWIHLADDEILRMLAAMINWPQSWVIAR